MADTISTKEWLLNKIQNKSFFHFKKAEKIMKIARADYNTL